MLQLRRTLLIPLMLMGTVTMSSMASAEDFYKGKTLTIAVGFTAGGGFDLHARTVARHISKHIPGNPTVIVQNMPGAGSLTSVRFLDATAAKDGTVMSHFHPGLVTQSVIEPEKVGLDFRKFSWIGVITPDYRVCYGYGPNGVKTWADLMQRKEFIMGATAKGAGNYVNGATLREVLGAPVRQVLGFPGSSEQRLAMERGEIDGDCTSFSSIAPGWIEEKRIHLFARFTDRKLPEIPDNAVYMGNFTKTEEQKEVLELLNVGDVVGRPFVMSHQVPAERVAIIRKAFSDAMKDPAFAADMKRQQFPLDPISGEDAQDVIAKMMNVSPAIVAKAKKVYD
jgi:tripartite-type tricarboxylate transporter receptor subunit TctC